MHWPIKLIGLDSSATRKSGFEVTALMANISGTNEQDVIQTVGKHTVSDVRYQRGCA